MLVGPYFLIPLFAVVVLLRKKVNITVDLFLLLFFALWYILCQLVTGRQMTLNVLMVPVAYYIGLRYDEQIDTADVVKVYQILAWGMCAHLLLNFFSEIITHRGLYFGAIHFDVWSGYYSAVTGQMLNLTMFLPLLSYMILTRKKMVWGILATAAAMLYGVIAGSRSILILFAANALVSTMVYIVTEKKNRVKILLIGALCVTGLTLLGYIMYTNNWLNVKTIWDSSYLAQRFSYSRMQGEGLFDTERWKVKWDYMQLMKEFPWGGKDIADQVGIYAHDLWMDTWDQAGLVPMLMIITYTVRLVWRFIKAIRQTPDSAVKVLLASYVVVFLMQIMAEPILQGAPIFVMSACLLDGMIAKMLSDDRKVQVRLS